MTRTSIEPVAGHRREAMFAQLSRNPAAIRLAIIAVLLAVWEAAAGTLVDADFLSPPTLIVETLFSTTLVDPKVVDAILLTFYELVVAFVLSVAFGVAVGLWVGLRRETYRSVFPLILMIYAIPQVTLLPLFILVFGLGSAGKLAFGFSHGIFPLMVTIVAGCRDVNPMLIRAARSMGASESQILRRIVLPYIVPSFFTGMRLAMTLTLLGVILAELYVSTEGIGYFTQVYAETFDPAPLFALILVLAAMAVTLNETLRRAELRFSRWKN
jgi:NitT/TauT family transport system permease protein